MYLFNITNVEPIKSLACLLSFHKKNSGLPYFLSGYQFGHIWEVSQRLVSITAMATYTACILISYNYGKQWEVNSWTTCRGINIVLIVLFCFIEKPNWSKQGHSQTQKLTQGKYILRPFHWFSLVRDFWA